MLDFAVFDLATLLFHLNPCQVPQRPRSPFNRPVNGVRVAYHRRSGNLGDAVGVIGHAASPSEANGCKRIALA